MSTHISNEDFLSKITPIFQEANSLHRNVRVSMKRIIEHNEVEKPKELDSSNFPEYDISRMSREYMPVKKTSSEISQQQYSILLRAVMGAGNHQNDKSAKTKISTVIKAKKFDYFWQKYSINVKAGMTGLSKKKKKKVANKKEVKKVVSTKKKVTKPTK